MNSKVLCRHVKGMYLMLYTQGILIEPGDKYITHLAIYHELLACYIILSYSTLLFKIYNFKTIVKTKKKGIEIPL